MASKAVRKQNAKVQGQQAWKEKQNKRRTVEWEDNLAEDEKVTEDEKLLDFIQLQAAKVEEAEQVWRRVRGDFDLAERESTSVIFACEAVYRNEEQILVQALHAL